MSQLWAHDVCSACAFELRIALEEFWPKDRGDSPASEVEG